MRAPAISGMILAPNFGRDRLALPLVLLDQVLAVRDNYRQLKPSLRSSLSQSDTENIIQALDREIHVWSSQLDQPEDVVESYCQILGEGDRSRLSRYKTEQLRNRHTVARGILVSLIALYTRKDVRQIELESDGFHKPLLKTSTDGCVLQFSVSHCDQMAMYAFARRKLIGVDVESCRAPNDWTEVKEICFSDYEKAWFSKLPDANKAKRFVEAWTIKEAYLKAIGTGLAISPASVELDFDEGSGYQLRRLPDEYNDGKRWNILSLSLVPGFTTAVVVEETAECKLRTLSWES